MLVYKIFLLFKMDKVSASECRQWILTFRLKYVLVAGKIIRTARQTILKLLEGYSYKGVFPVKEQDLWIKESFNYLWIV